ncbi:endonuclease/exonuclease/phosphatase family protein [Novosphingobium sp. BL-8H]|uniref:endonuclease/exonuclease/phosphatase family protein n=1 Tax=Novosphingobium sp. BL-8H TaxID=3127640 RepID=UPI0037565290
MFGYIGAGGAAGAQLLLATKIRASNARVAGVLFAIVAVLCLLAEALGGQPATAVPLAQPVVSAAMPAAGHADLSVMTYNVKGLPWPLASGRPQALAAIGDRLAQLRRMGRQPQVVVLQEAFIPEAKAIARAAGYAHVVVGPQVRAAPDADQAATRNWLLGETGSAQVDSGLVLMSDLPIRRIERAAFPPTDCAGYDCLAAKGVLVAELALPGGGAVRVATTHLNCRKASGTSSTRSDTAFARQAAFLGNLLARDRADGVPTILAGDFNQGQRPDRIAMLHGALDRVPGADGEDALSRRFGADPAGMARLSDARWIHRKARDMQFTFDGGPVRLAPVGIEIPFGTEPDGSMLSDHMGYTVHYALQLGGGRI